MPGSSGEWSAFILIYQVRRMLKNIIDYVFFSQAYLYRKSSGKRYAHYYAQTVCGLSLLFTSMFIVELVSWGRINPKIFIVFAVVCYILPVNIYTENRLVRIEEKYSSISQGAKIRGIIIVWGWFFLSLVLWLLCTHLIVQSKLQ